ncbi:hypothetical protein E3P99_03065 [Wallemia hederae]|uniref:RGS domain-containing protein n=1 Tax=Wallemia hederae TaxID=1540922 RepID=A0A4V4LSS7_9BASI|nr:hypothetical protein E3P99_03065 [Wallemia hederae]
MKRATLHDILSNEDLLHSFSTYLRDVERSIENLEFHMWYSTHVQRGTHITPYEGTRVLRTFFSRTSAWELNLDADEQNAVVHAAQQHIGARVLLPLSIFTHSHRVVVTLLECSSLPAYRAHVKRRKRERSGSGSGSAREGLRRSLSSVSSLSSLSSIVNSLSPRKRS